MKLIKMHGPWNLEKPDIVRDIHRQYFEAGSDVVHTNTFLGNPLKLADGGTPEKAALINQEAARLAREVCPEGGPMGPPLQLAFVSV